MSEAVSAQASPKQPRGIAARSHPGMPRVGGRATGTPNKWNGDIKAMVVEALKDAGGVGYLVKQAHKNPVAFLGLVGRVLPLQVTGANGGPLEVRIGIDQPPRETREEWLARRDRELRALEPPTIDGKATNGRD